MNLLLVRVRGICGKKNFKQWAGVYLDAIIFVLFGVKVEGIGDGGYVEQVFVFDISM